VVHQQFPLDNGSQFSNRKNPQHEAKLLYRVASALKSRQALSITAKMRIAE
jgi:hypothetical protein